MDIKRLKNRYLPEEIITEEILARLPVKSVLRFRSVSKAWCSLFDSERFIKTHLQLSAKNKARGNIISGVGHQRQIYVESLLKEEISCEPPFDIIVVINGSICKSSRAHDDQKLCIEVVGCCNGLVCIKNTRKRGRFYLWNPSTRISKELPIGRIDLYDCNCFASGFGWDESSGAYKVCARGFTIDDRKILFEVYSSKTKSWKVMDDEFNGIPLPIHGEGMVVSGKVYWREWAGDNGDIVRFYLKIVWFDLKSEVFGVMEQTCTPVCDPQSYNVLLGEHEGCLCVVSFGDKRHSRIDVWVMKESNWFHAAHRLTLTEVTGNYGPDSVIAAAPDGQIWLTSESGYLAYDPKRKLFLPFKRIQEGIDFFYPYLCIQSLVHP